MDNDVDADTHVDVYVCIDANVEVDVDGVVFIVSLACVFVKLMLVLLHFHDYVHNNNKVDDRVDGAVCAGVSLGESDVECLGVDDEFVSVFL